jgi:hypothetical protein
MPVKKPKKTKDFAVLRQGFAPKQCHRTDLVIAPRCKSVRSHADHLPHPGGAETTIQPAYYFTRHKDDCIVFAQVFYTHFAADP